MNDYIEISSKESPPLQIITILTGRFVNRYRDKSTGRFCKNPLNKEVSVTTYQPKRKKNMKRSYVYLTVLSVILLFLVGCSESNITSPDLVEPTITLDLGVSKTFCQNQNGMDRRDCELCQAAGGTWYYEHGCVFRFLVDDPESQIETMNNIMLNGFREP